MQVILRKDVPQLGRIGEVVSVPPGYARNFLFPRNLAVSSAKGNVRGLEHAKRLMEFQKMLAQKESAEVAKKLEKMKLTLTRRFNESGKLFGSISGSDFTEELKTKGYIFDRRDFEFEEMKVAGDYKLKVRLPGDVYAEISVTLEALEEPKAEDKKAKGKGRKATAKKTTKAKTSTEDAEVEAESE